MKNIALIVLTVSLLATISANAQIGITRNGQLNSTLFDNDVDIFVDGINRASSGFFIADYLICPIFANQILPKYLPKTKKVKINVHRIYFDSFNETMGVGDSSEYQISIEYDNTGKITSIQSSTPCSWCSNYKLEPNIEITFSYDNAGRLFSIDNNHDDNRFHHVTRLFYDKKGHLSKMKFVTYYWLRDVIEYHITWGEKGDIPRIIKMYYNGNSACDYIYTVSENGRKVTLKTKSYGYDWVIKTRNLISVTRDAKGHIVEEYTTDNDRSNYRKKRIKTKYDTLGNLVEQLFYEQRDIGNGYTSGFKYEYEYEFYE